MYFLESALALLCDDGVCWGYVLGHDGFFLELVFGLLAMRWFIVVCFVI